MRSLFRTISLALSLLVLAAPVAQAQVSFIPEIRGGISMRGVDDGGNLFDPGRIGQVIGAGNLLLTGAVDLQIGDSAVIVAASAPHRAEAFAACRAAIERLKQDVPIWKREVATDGHTWVVQGP